MRCSQLGWSYSSEFGVCGSSNAGMGGCLHSATWHEALARCNEHGARLCTRAELPVNERSGCGHDAELVWVWEACDHSGSSQHHVAAVGSNVNEYVCHDASQLHAVR